MDADPRQRGSAPDDPGEAASPLAWASVTIDPTDPPRLAAFWASLLRAPARRPGPDRAGWFRLGPFVPGCPVLNVQPVTEQKVGKSRVHLDLWVDDLDNSIAVVERLGGRRAAKVQHLERGRIAVMVDPEGNEFCLLAVAVES